LGLRVDTSVLKDWVSSFQRQSRDGVPQESWFVSGARKIGPSGERAIEPSKNKGNEDDNQT